VQIPEAITERFPFLEPLEEPWAPMPRVALMAWVIFYVFVMIELVNHGSFPGLMDGVFVPIHEGGHLIFRVFGEFLCVAGGTFMQLCVPFALACSFAWRREAQGVAFCLFFMFEQFFPIATYMADARRLDLPLLTVGDAEYVIHDWEYLFGRFHVLQYDTTIASAMRTMGWLGMLGVCLWLVWRGVNDVAPARAPITANARVEIARPARDAVAKRVPVQLPLEFGARRVSQTLQTAATSPERETSEAVPTSQTNQ
jgi:hypothetical protein